MAEPVPLRLGGSTELSAQRHGLKAHGLDRALRQGEAVPAGFVLEAELAQRIVAGDATALGGLRAALAELPGETAYAGTLAVRASSPRSMPGGLLTGLDVADELESVVRAIAEVLASAATRQVAELARAEGGPLPETPWLAVLVQRQLRFAAGDFGAVVFSHDTHSGAARVHGEFASSGVEAVVSGRSQPRALSGAPAVSGSPSAAPRSLAQDRPVVWEAIVHFTQRLVRHFEEPLDLELAFCEGKLWLLQARPLRFAARALVQLALSAIEDDSPRYAHWLRELAQRGLTGMVEWQFDPAELEVQRALLSGVAASPGVAVGVLVIDLERAAERAKHEPVILVRPDAVPEDVATIRIAQGLVTSSGGLTCHAAVIARGLGIPAVVGASSGAADGATHPLRVDVARGVLWGGREGRQQIAREGDWLSLDARRGRVYAQRLQRVAQLQDAELRRLFAEVRKLRPTPLWVSGPAAEALRLKVEASLDGALCQWQGRASLPAAEGRECWVVIDASEVEACLPTLPAGWGVVVAGAHQGLSIATLRRRFPLRALGVQVSGAEPVACDAPLDLAVFSGVELGSLQNQVAAARHLHVVNFLGDLPVPEGTNVGWVCPVSSVALTALGYATQRAASPARVVR